MNVLSLFDGMSCGRIALIEAGIRVNKYYASEIDKHAIANTMHNFPGTIQLGSVVNVDVSTLDPIDILIGGSPCQSFSFAGKRKGMSTKCEIEITRLEQYLELKAQGFEFEGQSYLFWEYMRILTDIRKYNPDVMFLLENVEMGVKWERVLSEAIGIYGVHINSALVSAQNRKRIYWTNIRVKKVGLFGELHSDIPQPKDRGILLKDILESEVDEKYYLKDSKYIDFVTDEWRLNKKYTQIYGDKSLPQMARQYQSWCGDYISGCAKFGRNDEAKKIRRENMKKGVDYSPFAEKEIYDVDFDKMNTLTTAVNKDNLIVQINPSTESGGKQPYQQNRIYDTEGISPALCANKADLLIKQNYAVIGDGYEQDNRAYYEDGKSGTLDLKSENRQKVLLNNTRIRRLTPTECARLQTVPDWYKWVVSDTQQYRMLGNGWTVDVISHIFSFIPIKVNSYQLTEKI